jgi:hypothetical protein
MNKATSYFDSIAVAFRSPEVPAASWITGMNGGGSCAPGIGIATDVTGLAQSLPNWTLLDQDGDARTPQVSQQIGGSAIGAGEAGKGILPILVVTPTDNGDGDYVINGDATLADLAAGWIAA